MKLNETPEEKRARRIKKKADKEAARKKKAGIDDSGYSNGVNPFGDANLGEQFVWHKKQEAAESRGISLEEQKYMEKDRRRVNKIELEKVKKRRAQREQEKLDKEKEDEALQRDKEGKEFEAWLGQEDQFHLEQAKRRSEIRIKSKRAKPIDMLAHYINTAMAPDDVDMARDMAMHEPYVCLNGLSIEDLEDLLEDIDVYQQLEGGANNTDFWVDMRVISQSELTEARRRESSRGKGPAQRHSLDTGVNIRVVNEIHALLKGKSRTQLLTLQEEIKNRIARGDSLDSINYWESLLKELDTHLAKARLRERHQEMLELKLQTLRRQQQEKMDDGDVSGPSEAEDDTTGAAPVAEVEIAPQYLIAHSPRIIYPGESDDDVDEKMVEPYEDEERIRAAREAVLEEIAPKKAAISTGGEVSSIESSFVAEAGKGMGADEETFNFDVQIEDQVCKWRDKYKPRKPRFFNRVHTGYEWNKYNQTHYSTDNPPPKVVQGYKFNIFYPDLIDKTKTPQYSLTPVPGEPGFCILKIMAGAPYEDIAFKIVDRPWEYASRNGFRSQFQHHIFQLWFHFQRERYRR